jgi:hypothetical protein
MECKLLPPNSINNRPLIECCNYKMWLALCAATYSFFLISVFFSGIVGTGEVRPADTVGSEVSGTYCGERYVFTLLWDVT